MSDIPLDLVAIEKAGQTKIPFGKTYRGQKLKDIAKSNKGLMYLDWLTEQDWLADPFKNIVKTYISHPQISNSIRCVRPHFRK